MKRHIDILILLLAVQNAGAATSRSPPLTAESDILSITMAAGSFRMDYGTWPSNESWLGDLAFPSDAQLNARQVQYLDATRDWTDPWGTPYFYRVPGLHNTNTIDVWSNGRDKLSKSGGNDPDDINNWNTNHPWRIASTPIEYHRTMSIAPTHWLILAAAAYVLVVIVSVGRIHRARLRRSSRDRVLRMRHLE